MKIVIAGAVALMVTTMAIPPIVVADSAKAGNLPESPIVIVAEDGKTGTAMVAVDEKRSCLLNGNSWSTCFGWSSVDSYLALKKIIIDSNRENLGVGLGTDSAVRSIRKNLANGRLF